jgi:hypothetical protein
LSRSWFQEILFFLVSSIRKLPSLIIRAS